MITNAQKHICKTIDNKFLELIIFPTEQCNFRCTYCYEDFSIGRMSDSVIQGIKSIITERSKDLDHLHLSWFGGEPLIAKDIIFDICEHALNQSDKLLLTGMTTTNGYHLTPDLMRKLCSYKQNTFQISLDGFGDAHDMTRKSRSGKGTFKRIWKNLLELRKTDLDFKITLRVHITPENHSSLKILAQEIKANFEGDGRFKIFLKAITNMGGPNANHLKILTKEESLVVIKDLESILYGEQKVVSLASRKEDQPYVCYASKPNSFTVRANGKIQKCTVMLDEDINTVGRIDEYGNLNINPEKMQVWLRGYTNTDLGVLSCPAKGINKNSSQPKSEIPLINIG